MLFCWCSVPKGKKGKGEDSDKEDDREGSDAPPAKKPPTKKEQRRIDEQARLAREAEVRVCDTNERARPICRCFRSRCWQLRQLCQEI